MSYEPNPATLALLDPAVPVLVSMRSPVLDALLGEDDGAWPDRATAAHFRQLLQAADLVRVARPPDLAVTVDGVPGRLTAAPGSAAVVWSSREPG